MTLAESDYLCFAVGGDAIMRLARASPSIRKSLIDGCKRPLPKFIHIAAPNPVPHGYSGDRISMEQVQYSPHTPRMLGIGGRPIIGHCSNSCRQCAP